MSMVAVQNATGGNAVVARQPLQYQLADLIELSERMADVPGFVPSSLLRKPSAVLATMLAGHGLGLDPMVSLRAIFVIEGKVALSAEIARGLVYAAGHHIDVVTYEDNEVTVRGKRRDEREWSLPVSWTTSRAERAKLTGRQNWQRYPRQMLSARATGELARLKFSDALAGLDVVADEEVLELVGGETVAEVAPAKRTSTRRANVKAPGLSPAPASLEATLVPPVVETDAGGTPVTAEGDAAPSAEPEPEPEPEPVFEAHREEPTVEVAEGPLPAWQRRLHARVGEVFSGASPEVRDDYRHAMVAVLTRRRDGGPVASSSLLDDAERMGFDAILNNVEQGSCLIGRLGNGQVELRQDGWCYRVTLDPLEVRAIREAG